jgi:hypothetical protein
MEGRATLTEEPMKGVRKDAVITINNVARLLISPIENITLFTFIKKG